MIINESSNRFELDIEGQIVFADFDLKEDQLFITHVETPVSLRGKGAAAKLMQEIADHADKQKLQIIPVCSYASAWVKHHVSGTTK